jgi:hypothetical protein
MIKLFLRCGFMLVICLSSCTKKDEIGCWKCTIKKSASVETRTICDKTAIEASNQVLIEEMGSTGNVGNMKIHCERD